MRVPDVAEDKDFMSGGSVKKKREELHAPPPAKF